MNPEAGPLVPVEPAHQPPRHAWHEKALAVVFVIFCFEIGVCLLIVPWSQYWNLDFLAFPPFDLAFWNSPYLKGAVSGLGLVNIWISLTEVVRLRRFAESAGAPEGRPEAGGSAPPAI